jgi:hypothetical protein
MNRPFPSSPVDDAIRQALALAGVHVPQKDIAAAALALAKARQIALAQRAKALQRMNQLWRALALAATCVVAFIIVMAVLSSLSTGSQTASSVGAEATRTATATITTTGTSAATTCLEWILLLTGLVMAWLIMTSVLRAVSIDAYEGLLA